MEFAIRKATPADAEAVHDIYGYYVDETDITFSTVNPSVSDYREKIITTEKLYPFYVAESGEKVIGFTYASRLRPHDAYLWDAEGTICLAPDCPRCMGIGSALYSKLCDTLKRQGFKSIFGVIVTSNEASIALHEALGFKNVGQFDNMGYKHGKWHSITWMQKQLGKCDGEPLPPVAFSEIED